MLHWTLHRKGIPEIPCDVDAVVAVDHKMYFFRGDFIESERRTEVHVFNTVTLCSIKLPPETPGKAQEVRPMRTIRTAVLIDPFIYIWGGMTGTGNCSMVLYAFDVDDHRMLTPRVSGTVPEGRYYHSACVLGNVMYIHGGYTGTEGYSNDMYKLDTNTMVWSLINLPPTRAHGRTATIIGTKVFVVGGGRDISVFDTETNHCMNTPSIQPFPNERRGHSAFAYNGELYIFRGYTGVFPCTVQYFNDLWKFNPDTFSWKEVNPKGNGPSNMIYGCCFIVGDRLIQVGACWLYVLDFSPSLKTLCELAVIQYALDQSELPHNIRWELAAMTSTESKRS